MVPRQELYAIEASIPRAELLSRVLASPYSRIPIYRGTLDDIIGVVSTKDVVGLYAARGEVPPLEQLLRRIPFVPEHLRADRFIRTLTEKRSSKAIVVDEFGGVQGIISIEDILAELLGDIGDELKPADSGVQLLSDGSMLLPGSMGLGEAENWLGRRWEGQAATLGGHIVMRLGRMPVEGEELVIDGVCVRVVEMSPNAIRLIRVQPTSASSTGHADASEGSD
jgi:CBS domain containing-hemolysin-like protein